MDITGHWYSADSSKRSPAQLTLSNGSYELTSLNEDGTTEVLRQGTLDSIRISDRVGNIPRKVYWSDAALFETTDNDSIDKQLALEEGYSQPTSVLHRLERNTSWVVAAVIVTTVVGVVFVKFGMPKIATKIAYSLPISVTEKISTGSLKSIDRFMFSESALPEARQAEVTENFQRLVNTSNSQGFTFKLHFRNMKGIANAMALPGGDIVVTDALFDVLETQDQLDAVLLHEIGHVVERHGLQILVQASTVSVVATIALGDATGMGDLAIALPSLLMQSSYSRDYERAADEFAFKKMIALDIDPIHFATMIEGLSRSALGGSEETISEPESEVPASESDATVKGAEEGGLFDYLSSHPLTAERAARAREMSEQYRNGDAVNASE